MDTTAIGTAAAGLMETIEEEFGDDAAIEAALVVVDVTYGEDHGWTAVRYRSRNGEGELLSTAHTAGLAMLTYEQVTTPLPDDG